MAISIMFILAVGFVYFKDIKLKPLALINTGVVSFAGYNWDYEVNNHHTPGGSCSGYVSGDETANLNIEVVGSSAGAGCDVYMTTQTPINDVDEFLVIFDSSQFAGFEMGASAGVFITDKTRYDTRDESQVITQIISYSDGVSGGKSSFSQYFTPKLIKLKNNFDGTYSILTSLGVGDVFIVKNTVTIPKDKPLYLGLSVSGGGGAGGSNARSTMTVYNIGRKESAFAVCTANQFIQDVNGDNKIATDGSECFDLKTIVLNNEEFVKESDFAKQQRILEELQAKNEGLTADLNNLKQQLANQQIIQQPSFDDTTLRTQIIQIEQELKDTRLILADVQSGDKQVINTISQEQPIAIPVETKISIWVWIIFIIAIVIIALFWWKFKK